MKLQEAWRDVIRPTMRREPKVPGNKGVQVVMVDLNGDGIPDPPAPEREDITVATATKWAADNVYEKDNTVYFNTAVFTGGTEGSVTYRWRLQKRATPEDGWTNYSWTNCENDGAAANITCPEGQMRIHTQARDASVDPAQQVNSMAPVKTVAESYEPLVVGDPVLTGQAIVGYTLSCSQPSIEGGSGDYTINYYWQDANSKSVLYMGATQKVLANDIGRTMCCQVYVADNQTGENFTVVSNSVGPVNRPVLPEFDVWVDGELHEDPTADIGVEPNGTVVIEVRQMPVSNAPADLAYEWKIRNGTGRLSGDLDGTGIIYLAPEAAPAGALVTCLANSLDANDSAYAAEVPILVAE